MKKFCTEWIQEWCQENGWTDLFTVRREYWAFGSNPDFGRIRTSK
jgi:hypothetical protein